MIDRLDGWRAVLYALIFPVWIAGAELQPRDILQKVEETLNAATAIQVEFEEIYEWRQTGEKQSLQGELILKGKNLFRVTTQDQILVSDGVTLWTYSKPSNRVLIDRVETSNDNTLPQQLFFSYRKDYQVKLIKEEVIAGTPCWVLLFTAEKKDLYIVEIKVWIEKDKFIPRKIIQTDIGKNKITYILNRIHSDVVTDASTFQFVVPEGAEVIRL